MYTLNCVISGLTNYDSEAHMHVVISASTKLLWYHHVSSLYLYIVTFIPLTLTTVSVHI